MNPPFVIDQQLVERFAADLDALVAPGARVGVAVSGGPDSLALLLLAAAARPGLVEAASVDHGLRPGSRSEAEMVAALCERSAVQHSILTIAWPELPERNLQARAREARYELLGSWALERGLT
ncbi:MAG TPA: ATP-binding protein, partial [Sphingomicrobium sp.]|nr:ATP-binding protein [Sphingomicrobium sp.]